MVKRTSTPAWPQEHLEYLKEWHEQFIFDKVRIPQMELAVTAIRTSVEKIELNVDKQSATLYGNGEPEKALLTRVGVIEKALERVVGTDQWRKVVLVGFALSMLASITTGLIMRYLIAAPKVGP